MKYKINLFPAKEKSFTDRIIYFSFHYLRYILVITQIIVIGVFFYRFKVDQEIVDLKDALSQKQEIITISEPLTKEVQAIENKTNQVKKIIDQQEKVQEAFKYFLSVFPEKLFLEKLTINNNGGFSFSGKTMDPNIVKIFYNRLKKDKQFGSVNLKSIIKEEDGYNFNFTLKDPVTKK